MTAVSPICIVGCGIAGLYAALKLADAGRPVLLLTKAQGWESNSRYAQGGIATVLPGNPDDSLERHVADTLTAGAGRCNPTVVASILADGYAAVADLLRYGVPFDRDASGQLTLTREAAHSVNRILHAGGDATGQQVENTLAEKVNAHPLITKRDNVLVLDVLTQPGPAAEARVCGLLLADKTHQRVERLAIAAVVLATGGLGQLYAFTSNPAIATGDGLAMAVRAGVPLADMAFVQFHPTAFYQNGETHFLISEAVRGEGARLLNLAGEPFAHHYHPAGELAPRDVVTRAIFSEMTRRDEPHVLLDVTQLPAEYSRSRFPSIYEHACRRGVDFTRQPLPVAPAAHYAMGGIAVDVRGRSPLAGLTVIGEAACTGLHGANRLASNSLLECLVLAKRAAEDLAAQTDPESPTSVAAGAGGVGGGHADCWHWQAYPSQWLMDNGRALRQLMWQHVGIVRTPEGLQQAQQQLTAWLQETHANRVMDQLPHGWEWYNLLLVAQAVVQQALAEPRSVGAHYVEAAPLATATHG